MAPGTTHTSRPASSASSAVENVPEGSPASTMSVARESPAMSRLRARKAWGWGGKSHSCSETTAPPAATMRWKSPAFSAGYSWLQPPPRKATVGAPAARAASWATASQPRAPPEMMATPRSAAAAAKRLAQPRP